MKKPKLSVRETVMVVALVILLIAVIYYMGFYTPLQAELARIETEIAGIETQMSTYQEKLAKMNRMQAELDEILKTPEDKLTEVAPYDNLVEVLVALDKYLYENSINYKLNFYEPKIEEDGTVRRDINMNFDCRDYDSAREMVDDLTGNKWRCLVGTTKLNTINQNINIENGIVTVNLQVTFFELSEFSAE